MDIRDTLIKDWQAQPMKILDLATALDHQAQRNKLAKPLEDQLVTAQDFIRDWKMSGRGPLNQLAQSQAQGTTGTAGAGPSQPVELPTKSVTDSLTGIKKPETFGWLDKAITPLEKLGVGVERGVEALLSPLSGVLDVAYAPAMRGLEAKLGAKLGVADIESKADAFKTMLEDQSAKGLEILKSKLSELSPGKTLEEQFGKGQLTKEAYKELKTAGKGPSKAMHIEEIASDIQSKNPGMSRGAAITQAYGKLSKDPSWRTQHQQELELLKTLLPTGDMQKTLITLNPAQRMKQGRNAWIRLLNQTSEIESKGMDSDLIAQMMKSTYGDLPSDILVAAEQGGEVWEKFIADHYSGTGE